MLRSIEATVEINGEVRLLEPLHMGHTCRAIVTIFDEPDVPETAILSESCLARDWERPEEDKAWAHLQ
jgi:hypothetical protein